MTSAVTRTNGNGKEKGNQEDTHDSDAAKAENTKSYYCGMLGHRRVNCRELAADKPKVTQNGKPHSVTELAVSGSSSYASRQISTLSVSLQDPDDQIDSWILAQQTRPTPDAPGLWSRCLCISSQLRA